VLIETDTLFTIFELGIRRYEFRKLKRGLTSSLTSAPQSTPTAATAGPSCPRWGNQRWSRPVTRRHAALSVRASAGQGGTCRPYGTRVQCRFRAGVTHARTEGAGRPRDPTRRQHAAMDGCVSARAFERGAGSLGLVGHMASRERPAGRFSSLALGSLVQERLGRANHPAQLARSLIFSPVNTSDAWFHRFGSGSRL
jgi:hypothetical protein